MITAAANASQYDWQTWFMGGMRAFIAGASGAVTGILGPMATDSADFNFGNGLRHTLVSMTIGFFVGGIVQMMVFLQTHSAPDKIVIRQADATTTVSPTPEGGLKVTTVATAVAEPAKETK